MRVKIIRKCSGVMPCFFDDGWLFASRGARVMRSADLGASWETVGMLYRDWRAVAAGFRIVDRLLKFGAFNMTRLPDGGLFAITGVRQRYLPLGGKVFFPIQGPVDFRPMRRGLWVDSRGTVLIGDYRDNGGEYRGNRTRDAVPIWRCADPAEGRWERLYSFDRGHVRHIHSLTPDTSIPGRIWISTGDEDDECMIAFSDDELRSLQVFTSGCQEARATDLLFTDQHVYWGIESPRTQSGIVRRRRDGGEIEWLQVTPCPAYYATSNEAGFFSFSTTVEPGPGVTGNDTEIYTSADHVHYHVVWSRRNDFIPQYAQTHFPRGVVPDDFIVWASVATTRDEGTMFVGRIIP